MTDIDRESRQPACPTWPAEPWPLRLAPEPWRPCLLYIGAWLGGFCYMAIVFSGSCGLIALPLALAAFKPEIGVSRVVLWFHRLIGPRWFLTAYMAVMVPLVFVMMYGMQVAIYIRVRHGKKYFDFPTRRDAYSVAVPDLDQRLRVDD